MVLFFSLRRPQPQAWTLQQQIAALVRAEVDRSTHKLMAEMHGMREEMSELRSTVMDIRQLLIEEREHRQRAVP